MKKVLILFYGIAAYVLFLASFLYLVGFLNDSIVPKSIDDGQHALPGIAILVDIALISVFGLQHSIMARPGFKQWFTRIIPPAMERSTYVLLSSLTLILLYWLWLPLPAVFWRIDQVEFHVIVYAIQGLGWLVVLLSTLMINHFELFGLKQVYFNAVNRQPTDNPFSKSIFYGLVRHPLMLGFMIAFWATPVMTSGRLLYAIVNTIYIFIAVKFYEEKDLQKMHGETYTKYKKEVPMFIPFTKLKRK